MKSAHGSIAELKQSAFQGTAEAGLKASAPCLIICVFLNSELGGGSSLLLPRWATHLLCTDSKTGDKDLLLYQKT